MPMPDSVGFLFPGQGAQFVGMGKDLAQAFPVAARVYEEADRLLGYSVSRLCFEGPEEDLTRTLYAQPAIFVTSMALLAVLRARYPELACGFAAGLSLGEFSALAACGSLSFADGLRLVDARAKAMERAAGLHPGTMASILGLSQKDCEAVCAEAGCEVANLNSPDQIAISGSVETVEKACRLAEARGAKRAIRLKVGGAFHSSLMREAKEDLEKALAGTPVQATSGIFVPNASAEPTASPEEIRQLLARQLMSPVRWIETMDAAAQSGIPLFLEVGPGKVLKGLARKCRPELAVEPCGTAEDLEKIQTLFARP